MGQAGVGRGGVEGQSPWIVGWSVSTLLVAHLVLGLLQRRLTRGDFQLPSTLAPATASASRSLGSPGLRSFEGATVIDKLRLPFPEGNPCLPGGPSSASYVSCGGLRAWGCGGRGAASAPAEPRRLVSLRRSRGAHQSLRVPVCWGPRHHFGSAGRASRSGTWQTCPVSSVQRPDEFGASPRPAASPQHAGSAGSPQLHPWQQPLGWGPVPGWLSAKLSSPPSRAWRQGRGVGCPPSPPSPPRS